VLQDKANNLVHKKIREISDLWCFLTEVWGHLYTIDKENNSVYTAARLLTASLGQA
jgi:hypothetical protein